MDDKDRPRASPSYFKNVVSLGSDGLPPAPSPRSMSHKSIKSTSSLHRAIQTNEGFGADGETHDNTEHDRLIPLASPTNNFNAGQDLAVRSRKGNGKPRNQSTKRRRKRKQQPNNDDTSNSGCCPNWCFGRCCGGIFWCCNDRKIVRSTLSCMNVVARILSWCTVVASVAGVVWYSYELKKTGKDPHLILWNSAAAFVLIGVPISIYGIVMHLANYNQPETQNYIVRILWMVPIFSIQSWLGLRFKDYSIYFETIRDMYEAYVLYSFLQFLIQVLGGEEALILMLKDKSPTRGVHYGGLQLCLKPWLMGQPLRKTFIEGEAVSSANNTSSAVTASETTISGMVGGQQHLMKQPNKPLKRVYWTSPFFLYCKFGVFQYVLLKFLSTIAILLLEPHGLYKEGSFSYKGGYLYICILTNFSQTWALYCFFFFYFATKNELTPIRPVGKFLSVKLLVFFTWWQSLFISILYQMQLIPHYSSAEAKLFGTGGLDDDALDAGGIRTEPDWTVPLSAEDASALDEHGGKAFWSPSADSSAAVEYSPEDVAKALQDYLICIEMFLFAIVHIFVFPHSEYSPEAVDARARALNQRPNKNWNKRLGRKWKEYDNKSAWSGTTNASSRNSEIELYPMNNHTTLMDRGRKDSLDEDDLRHHPMDDVDETEAEHFPLLQEEEENSSESGSYEDDDEFPDHLDDIDENGEEGTSQSPSKSRKKNFFSALLDSSIPQDLRDNAVGIIKGEYVVERKTLLHHAATSDSYDLLSRMSRPKKVNLRTTTKM